MSAGFLVALPVHVDRQGDVRCAELVHARGIESDAHLHEELPESELRLGRRLHVDDSIRIVGVKGRDAGLLASLLRDSAVTGAEALYGGIGDLDADSPGDLHELPITKTSRWACTW